MQENTGRFAEFPAPGGFRHDGNRIPPARAVESTPGRLLRHFPRRMGVSRLLLRSTDLSWRRSADLIRALPPSHHSTPGAPLRPGGLQRCFHGNYILASRLRTLVALSPIETQTYNFLPAKITGACLRCDERLIMEAIQRFKL